MTQEAQNYAIWRPEYDGHAPPNWREGMEWNCNGVRHKPMALGYPVWSAVDVYEVPAEALTAPNEDAKPDGWTISGALSIIRAMSPDELAKHGITLSEPKDWATELWADLMDAWNYKSWAQGIRDGFIVDADQKAIELLRTRFEQMKGEG